MASGAMVGWCSGSRWPSRPVLGFGGSTDTRALVRGVRGGNTAEQVGTRRARVRGRGHKLDMTTHGLVPSGLCMQVYACVQNSADAVMATAQNQWYARDNGPRTGR
jgi:hypothetical protein